MTTVVFDHCVLHDNQRIAPNTPFDVEDAAWCVSIGGRIVPATSEEQPKTTVKRTRKKTGGE